MSQIEITEMDEVLGARFCEPSKMKAPAKYNAINKDELQFCVQGKFKVEGYDRGHTDTRWQTIDDMTRRISREEFESKGRKLLRTLTAAFKREAKRFKPAAQLGEDE